MYFFHICFVSVKYTLSDLRGVDLHREYCMHFSESVFLPFTRNCQVQLYL